MELTADHGFKISPEIDKLLNYNPLVQLCLISIDERVFFGLGPNATLGARSTYWTS